MALLVTSAVLRMFCRIGLPRVLRPPAPSGPPDKISCPPAGPGAGAARTFNTEAGPETGTGTPEAAVGIALNEAMGLAPAEDIDTPAPGESWLDALSRPAAAAP